ncbi:hypothetical protein CXB51_001595 [Gossypium anomalum]|uniref:Uncharacterized protein n=1 Tax=Gossypium anomalum TaxID=47600 RepID=A0A8J6D9J1_9ROSI|nr:hypothetical protein CXB51_001595 [Gossypium anomalum]
MDDFCEIVDELSLVDLKIDNGWFTWVNNREGIAMVKERLDHFIIPANDVTKFPFIETKFNGTKDIMERMEKVCQDLGTWQCKKYKELSKQISKLKSKINRSVDNFGGLYEGNRLKAMRVKLGNLNDKEKYWAQRSRVIWLREGNRNTKFFHVRASSRRKKNNIERLKDIHGCWKNNIKDI